MTRKGIEVPGKPSDEQSPGSRSGAAPNPTGDPVGNPGRAADDPLGERARLLRRNQGRWKLSFSLFLLGFMLLIVVARKNPPAAEAWALRGTAAALCVGAFLLARQAHRNPHA
jgi:hypothetical protein